jgi:transposase
MAFLYKRMQQGRAYYYIRETARVNGKVKVVFQEYLGTIDAILKMKQEQAQQGIPEKTLSYDYGALWMFNEIDKMVDIAGIVDDVIPRGKNESGPTQGEYMYYTALNRCVEPKSKNALEDWYRGTGIQFIRPVVLSELTSSRYWDKWARIGERELDEIVERFITKVNQVAGGYSDCFLFDTTNQYTYFSSSNKSELAQRGKNKAGKHHLRQIGFALMVDRDTHLPLYFTLYEGNKHDSKLFNEVMAQMMTRMKKECGAKRNLTVVFDKGINSEENINYIDADMHVHFITSYSPYLAEDLMRVSHDSFRLLDIPKNERYREEDKEEEQVLAYRAERELWGEKRTVLVTYNPRTARKMEYGFQEKMDSLRDTLIDYRKKVNSGQKFWKKEDDIRDRYLSECERLHMNPSLYELSFEKRDDGLRMQFHKNTYKEKLAHQRFGKNIIVTDNMEWSAEEIYGAYLDRSNLEDQFRRAKSHYQTSLMPSFHWTDHMLRIFYFTCVVALSYMRLLEIRLAKAGVSMSAKRATEIMKTLHTTYIWMKGQQNPERMVDEPSSDQEVVLKALGYEQKRDSYYKNGG